MKEENYLRPKYIKNNYYLNLYILESIFLAVCSSSVGVSLSLLKKQFSAGLLAGFVNLIQCVFSWSYSCCLDEKCYVVLSAVCKTGIDWGKDVSMNDKCRKASCLPHSVSLDVRTSFICLAFRCIYAVSWKGGSQGSSMWASVWFCILPCSVWARAQISSSASSPLASWSLISNSLLPILSA